MLRENWTTGPASLRVRTGPRRACSRTVAPSAALTTASIFWQRCSGWCRQYPCATPRAGGGHDALGARRPTPRGDSHYTQSARAVGAAEVERRGARGPARRAGVADKWRLVLGPPAAASNRTAVRGRRSQGYEEEPGPSVAPSGDPARGPRSCTIPCQGFGSFQEAPLARVTCSCRHPLDAVAYLAPTRRGQTVPLAGGSERAARRPSEPPRRPELRGASPDLPAWAAAASRPAAKIPATLTCARRPTGPFGVPGAGLEC